VARLRARELVTEHKAAIDVAFRSSRNTWNGEKYLQLSSPISRLLRTERLQHSLVRADAILRCHFSILFTVVPCPPRR
jgi:hypothetical protein